MLSLEDEELWNQYTKTVQPLKNKKDKICFFLSPRRWFHKRKTYWIPETLDLHGLTLTEAFDLFRQFLQLHLKQGTKKVIIITGRGKNDMGAIKKEFPLWLENPQIQKNIVHFNIKNEGSYLLELRKNVGNGNRI